MRRDNVVRQFRMADAHARVGHPRNLDALIEPANRRVGNVQFDGRVEPLDPDANSCRARGQDAAVDFAAHVAVDQDGCVVAQERAVVNRYLSWRTHGHGEGSVAVRDRSVDERDVVRCAYENRSVRQSESCHDASIENQCAYFGHVDGEGASLDVIVNLRSVAVSLTPAAIWIPIGLETLIPAYTPGGEMMATDLSILVSP